MPDEHDVTLLSPDCLGDLGDVKALGEAAKVPKQPAITRAARPKKWPTK